MVEIIASLALVAVMVIGSWLCWRNEKREWNNGICPKCGVFEWRYFDTDSQGGHGYSCDNCNRTLWVSWLKEA